MTTYNLMNISQCKQNFASYTEQQHLTWQFLLGKQLKKLTGKASSKFISGLEKIKELIARIPEIRIISEVLFQETGWQLWPVEGLIEADDYFYLLSNKYFPVTTFLRNFDNLNYSPIPDIWHDTFGHLPLLFVQEYSDFIKYLGEIYITNNNFVKREEINRIYWYTIEAGICCERGVSKIYGASQLSSLEEINYALSNESIIVPFDLKTVQNTSVTIDKMQDYIFEIPNFEYLQILQNQLNDVYSVAQLN